MRAISRGELGGGSTRSTTPVAIAARGMPSYFARRRALRDGDAAGGLHVADARRSVDAVPESTTAIARSPRMLGERAEEEVDRVEGAASGRGSRWSCPSGMPSLHGGGIT